MKKNAFFVFLVVLFLIIASRLIITFLSDWPGLPSPELTYQTGIRGNDLYYGLTYQAYRIAHHQPLDPKSSYGVAASALIVPFVNIINFYHLYIIFSLIVFVGFPILAIIMIKNKQRKYLALLIIAAFFLGKEASLGLERGNLDLIFGLMTGVLAFLSLRKPGTKVQNYTFSSVIGLICGILVNTKLSYLPYAVILIGASYAPLIGALWFLISFFGFSFLPVLYGSAGDYLYPIRMTVMGYGRYQADPSVIYPNENHSLYSLSSLFTNCVSTGNCTTNPSHMIITIVTLLLSAVVFVLPFIRTPGFQKLLNLKKIFSKIRMSPPAILLALAYVDAAMNLFPLVAYSYRYYYTLALIIVGFTIIKSEKAYSYFLTALLFFLLQGLWIFQNIFPKGYIPFDARGYHMFLLVFYYFLFKSLWRETTVSV